MSVTVIIPALNEEENIGRVLAALRQAQDTAIPAGVADEIIVVDGGSSAWPGLSASGDPSYPVAGSHRATP